MRESNEVDLAEAARNAGALPAELSVVDAVLWACDQSEDETEVGDLVAAALGLPTVEIVRDPALDERPGRACLEPLS